MTEKKYLGWYTDIDDHEYHHVSPGVSSTGLKSFQTQTGAHYAYNRANPKEDTDALKIGKLFHALALEPDTVSEKFIARPDFSGKGSVAARKEFEAEHDDKVILKADHFKQALEMRLALMENPAVRNLIGDPDQLVAESSIYWRDGVHDILQKIRPDALLKNNLPFCVDIKTCVSASETEFNKAIANYGYHISAAMYLDGLRKCPAIAEYFGYEITHFIYIAVEKEPPYLSAVYELSPDDLALGQSEYRALQRRYADSKSAGFPGYAQTIRQTKLPAWANKVKTA